MFGDDEDDKDDLFAVKPKQQTVVGTKAQETSKSELLNSIESNKQTSDEDEMPKKKVMSSYQYYKLDNIVVII